MKGYTASTSNRSLRSLQFASSLGSFVLIVFVLYAAKEVLIPFALSILFAFLLTPACNWFQRRGLSNPAAVFLVSLFVAIVSLGAIVMIWASITEFATQIPRYKGEVLKKVEFAQKYAQDLTKQLDGLSQSSSTRKSVSQSLNEHGADGAEHSTPSSNEIEAAKNDDRKELDIESNESALNHAANGQASVDELPAEGTEESPFYVKELKDGPGIDWQTWAGGAGAVFGPLGTAGLVIVFALFLLIYRDDLRDRFIAVVSRGNYQVTTEAISEASERISRYLGAQILLNVSYGFVFGFGLMVIGWFLAPDTGFPNVLFLAVVAGLVRFIPYVGPLVGAGLPLTFSMAIFPGYSVFSAVLALIGVLELLSNNIVEPWLYGSRTGVSAIAIISSAVFWGWLWGAVGLLLATPLTVCLVVLGRHIPSLKFFVTLLSDERQVDAGLRIYQRLLAGEPHKLVEALEDEAKSRTLISFTDEVIVPAAKRILKDRDSDQVDDKELSNLLMDGIESSKVFSELSESSGRNADSSMETSFTSNTNSVGKQGGTVDCCAIAARHPSEWVVLQSIQKVISPAIDFEIRETSGVPETDAQSIAERRPAAVLIVSLPRGGMKQSKFWCRSLRAAGYEGTIVVARLGRFRHYDDLFQGFRRSGATTVSTTIAQTVRRLEAVRNALNPLPKSLTPVTLAAGRSS